jgi:trk system potassium uptake protein TrkH
VVLATTIGLIVAGAALVYVGEANNAMGDLSTPDAVANSFFLSVSPRTAGFNSVNFDALSGSTIILTIFFMVVGGSPGSTAGGIKTTTLFIVGAAVVSTLKNRQDITAFKRRIDDDSLKKACAMIGIYFGLAFLGIVVISLSQALPLSDVIFEVFSAIGTVGFMLGITPQLSVLSKLVIIFLMYFGRVGVLSLLFVFTKGHSPAAVRYPKEKIIVG